MMNDTIERSCELGLPLIGIEQKRILAHLTPILLIFNILQKVF